MARIITPSRRNVKFFFVVPKLCLGMRPAKLCLANLNRGNESGIGREGGEAKQSFAVTHSQAELGNDRRGAKRRFAVTHSQAALGNDRGAIGFRSLSSVSSTSRGWIVPVGDSIPDRRGLIPVVPKLCLANLNPGRRIRNREGLIREAKQSFAVTHSQAEIGNDRRGAGIAPPCRHSGIFIPPAYDSGIAVLRWRNENIRNLPRQRVVTPTGTPDRLSAEIPDIFIPRDCIRRGHSASHPRGMKIPE